MPKKPKAREQQKARADAVLGRVCKWCAATDSQRRFRQHEVCAACQRQSERVGPCPQCEAPLRTYNGARICDRCSGAFRPSGYQIPPGRPSVEAVAARLGLVAAAEESKDRARAKKRDVKCSAFTTCQARSITKGGRSDLCERHNSRWRRGTPMQGTCFYPFPTRCKNAVTKDGDRLCAEHLALASRRRPPCGVDGCSKPKATVPVHESGRRDLCEKHLARWRAGLPLLEKPGA